MGKLIIAIDICITNETPDVYFRFNGEIHIHFDVYNDMDDPYDEPGEDEDDPSGLDGDPGASSWPPTNYN